MVAVNQSMCHFPQLCMIQITANNLNVLAFINKNNQNRDERNTLGVSSKSRWLEKKGEHLGCACPAADPWWVDSAVIHGTKQLWPPIPALGVTKEALAKYRDDPMRAMKTFLTTAERRTPRWALMFSNCTRKKFGVSGYPQQHTVYAAASNIFYGTKNALFLLLELSHSTLRCLETCYFNKQSMKNHAMSSYFELIFHGNIFGNLPPTINRLSTVGSTSGS